MKNHLHKTLIKQNKLFILYEHRIIHKRHCSILKVLNNFLQQNYGLI